MKKLFSLLILFVLCAGIHHAFCWPSEFPTGTTLHQPEKAYQGYNIYVPMNDKAIEPVKMVDMDGNVVHRWYLNPLQAEIVKPLNGGRIMALTKDMKTLVEVDWDSRILWKFTVNGSEMHHDFQRLENGNTLIIARKALFIPDIYPEGLGKYDYLTEVTPGKTVVWNWFSWEHFDEFGFSEEAMSWIRQQRVIYSTDIFHTNTVFVLPPNKHDHYPILQAGNILMSQRNTNIVFIIDKDTGDIVWKIGPDDNLTIGQHDARMIEAGLPGEGNILLFDNGGPAGFPTKARTYSRVIEINPVTKRIVWQYDATDSGDMRHAFYSTFISGAQRLPNGNTLINEGIYGRFFEVAPDGEIVWEYIESNPVKMVYRVYRVSLDWPY